MFSGVVIKLINLANKLMPKVKERTVISAFPDYDDMTRAILEEECAIVLLSNKLSKRPLWLKSNVKSVPKNSLKGLWYLSTSSKIYFTHGLFRGFKVIDAKKQLVINLWHGMPLKNIGFLDGKTEVPDFHYVYSLNEFFAPIMAKAFNVGEDKVLIKDLPRNTVLCRDTQSKYLLELKTTFKSIIVWLPTYRKSNLGDIRVDGSITSIYCFENFNAKKLNDILVEKNSLLLVKPHPMAVVDDLSDDFSNIKIINENWLHSKGVTLYEVLAVSSMLWTDFSSVYVDYLQTQKPILFIAPDIKSFQGGRGFTFDITKSILPESIVTTEAKLLKEVLKI